MKSKIKNKLVSKSIIFCLLFLFVASTTTYAVEESTAELFQYHRGQDVFFMFMLVAFLMLFIKKFEWGVCLVTLLTLSVAFPLYVIIQRNLFDFSLGIELIITGIFCAITLIIAAGVIFGHVKIWHFIPLGILFVPGYILNEWFLFSYLEGVADSGGSILVHMFAAYWGWGVILALQRRDVNQAEMNATTHSISFVWLASMLLWVLWPSFTTSLLPTDLIITGMTTTYLALMASTLTAFLVLKWIKGELDPLIYTYAILAGGVAIGSTVDLVGPGTAWLIGAAGGIISVLCFLYLDDWLANKTNLTDTMGVNNLHGIPGIFGGLMGIPFAGSVQIYAIAGGIIIPLVTGLIAGIIVKIFEKPQLLLDDAEIFDINIDLERTQQM
ncbi:ammonium transporter [Acetohalobium arabaticum]|uniref:Ammonium transporter n=1 Tax=Acetohalobium arabaticum (strain ATCC 49924 / DSM 5501 / Z-7288) TaxID=574087 RepID=D9QQK4_ACEAZ|nr:ammonium transporter [Acetohalobium arabaticum]ADL12795.1 ammonium transporter [Acetohalobium arabaticum DSM 5501]